VCVCGRKCKFDGMLSALLFVLELERRVRARQSPIRAMPSKMMNKQQTSK
jgi:hypothetical protein